jgi:hypothetical protein
MYKAIHMHWRLGAAGVALLLAGTALAAQEVVRVRGTIERVEGGAYIVKARDGASLKLTLAPNAGVAASVKSALSDIKSGAYIGVAALPQADGTCAPWRCTSSMSPCAAPARGTVPGTCNQRAR